MSQPYKCPVCGGNGLVPNGFYSQTSGTWGSSSANPEKCRSCDGRGIVWGPADNYISTGFPPFDPGDPFPGEIPPVFNPAEVEGSRVYCVGCGNPFTDNITKSVCGVCGGSTKFTFAGLVAK